MSRFITAIIALGLFVLLIGLILPTAINASHTDASRGFQLSENETHRVTDGLSMTIESVQSSNATITLTDNQTRQSDTQTVQIDATNQFETTTNETMNVTLNEIDGNVTKTTVEYSRTYGWNDGAKLFADNLGLLIAIIAFLLAVGGLSAVVL